MTHKVIQRVDSIVAESNAMEIRNEYKWKDEKKRKRMKFKSQSPIFPLLSNNQLVTDISS